jgi:hypothetical protein
MRTALLLSLALLGLAACASKPTVYQPAAGPTAVGYAETPIERDRWRISFRGGTGAGAQRVGDLAMQRAADLTLAKGYDWFRVTDRETEGQGAGVRPSLSFGLGGSDFYGRSAVGAGGGIGLDFTNLGQSITVTVEVLMGRGPAPREPDAYDAREVRRSFGPQV